MFTSSIHLITYSVAPSPTFRDSVAYRRWRAAPLSTMAFTSDEDYATPSPLSSVGPSRKRCRSRATSVPLVAHLPGALSPVCVGLLPPRKRFRGPSAAFSLEDSIKDGSEASTKSDIDPYILTGIEADIAAEVAAVAETEGDDETEDDAESNDLPKPTIAERLEEYEETMQGMYEHLLEIPIQRSKDIEEEKRNM
ncbi:hypothetical protein Tco_0458529 [Tanacetum coccineum]